MGRKNNRILIICKGHQNVAGAQLYLKQISSLFPSTKYELHFALHKKDGLRVFNEIEKKCCVFLWEYDWRHLSFTKSFAKAKKLFQEINPSLILFNSSEDEILAPIWAAFFCKIPKRIMVVHWAQQTDSMPFFHRKAGIPFPSRYALKTRFLRSIGYFSLNKIIFVNKITRKAYAHLYRIPSKRCVTIYNGIDVSVFSDMDKQRTKLRNELKIAPNDCMVFASGNLTEVKGHKYLIAAIKTLLLQGINIKCFIAGQGELKQTLNQQIVDYSVENNVKLLGYRNDIPSLLSASDIFCMPSLNEALGYSLLEALAAGVPVVASNVGGIPEVIKNGKTGLLVQAGNEDELSFAIKKLYENVELRSNLAHIGPQIIKEQFSLHKMLDQTKSLFQTELS